MRFTLALVTSLMACTVSSLPVAKPNPGLAAVVDLPLPGSTTTPPPTAIPPPVPGPDITDAQIIKNAALAWRADTAKVSRFLDDAAASKFRSQAAYQAAAVAAYNAEADQQTQKYYLDHELIEDTKVQATNSTHTIDAFDSVVDLLLELSTLNYKKDCKAIKALVSKINFGYGTVGGRCTVALPTADVSFKAADARLWSLTRDKSLKNFKAVRPSACARSYTRSEEEAEAEMNLYEDA